MDKDRRIHQITLSMVALKWATKKVMVNLFLKVEINILDNFQKINIMETAHSNIVTEEDMKEIGYMVSCKERESLHGQMEENIQEMYFI